MHEPTDRLQRREHALHDQGKAWRLHPVVAALQALRGVPGTVAVTMGADMGERTRFAPPRELRKCLGLIPAEDAAGAQRRQGSLTQAGNTHARRALVEGAWADRDPAQVRRCQRSRRLVARSTPPTVVTVALAKQLPVTPSSQDA